MPHQTIDAAVVAVIPDPNQEQRLVFLARTGQHEKPIVLRQESYSPGVGWFTQSEIELSRQQMILLRSSLGGCDVEFTRPERKAVSQLSRMSDPDAVPAPAVVPFTRPFDRQRVGA